MSDLPPTACQPHQQRHLAREAACRAVAGVPASAGCESPPARRPRHTGPRWQRPRRSIERAVRVRSVSFDRWARRRGLAPREIARALRLAPRTLRCWRQQWRKQRLKASLRGRPRVRSTRRERNAVIDFLSSTGPAIPLAALRAGFPEMRPAELKRLLRRYRQECRRQRAARPQCLYWSCPGSVWATDFVEQLGGLSWVFSVRDLASRRQLLWRSVDSPAAATVTAAYEELFREHGPPLAMKSDNGSGFIAAETLDVLARHGVIPLFSPPRRPQYNGGCERGGGILKRYTKQVAACDNRPGVCLPSDLAAARQLANTLTRPWGHDGPSPDDAWNARTPLSRQDREAFQAELARARLIACQLLEYPGDQPLSRIQAARRDRRAVQQALETLGYLQIVTRRDPLLTQPPRGACPAVRPSLPPPLPCTNSDDPPAAPAEKACTLTSGAAHENGPPDSERTPSAHRESMISRVLRRSITPLLRILKPANNP
jgi:transposase InsO family protein